VPLPVHIGIAELVVAFYRKFFQRSRFLHDERI
jgi:hypothetical protein